MKRKIAAIIAAAALVTGGGFAFSAWRSHVIATQRERQERTVVVLLKEHHGGDALALLQLMRREAAGTVLPQAQEARWQKYELAASLQLRDMPLLLALYERLPDLLRSDETASLLVARALIAMKRPDEAAKLRDSWRGREQQKEDWLCYDADECLFRHKPEEAAELLTGTQFSGKADSGRLLRLAILNADKPPEALKYFNAAYAADRANPDLRSFRGQILENAGQARLARVEYTAALAAAPENPLLRDQLAEFYLRQHDYPLALQTLAESLRGNAFDFMWLKAGFWARVIKPLPAGNAPQHCPAGVLQPLAEMIVSLPAEKFWDEKTFERLRFAARYASERQEVFWLRLLQNLKDGRENEAADMLTTNTFKAHPLHSELEGALRIFLKFRQKHISPAAEDFDQATDDRHQLFESIAAWSKGQASPETETFAAGPYAFAGAFLAAGWVEAALQLVPSDRALPDAPDWFLYGIAQALRMNRDNATALAFAKKQPPTSLMRLAVGELLLAEGQKDEAAAELKKIAAENSDVGFRAAWLLAASAAEQRKFDESRNTVAAQPRLADSTAGREIVARVTLLQGSEADAARLYSEIESDSAEAKTFLARRAFANKNWDEARRLIRLLTEQFPDELSLRASLQAIDHAAATP